MSNIKKAVLFFYFSNRIIADNVTSKCNRQCQVCWTQINSDTTTLKFSVDHEWDNPIIDYVVETDYGR